MLNKLRSIRAFSFMNSAFKEFSLHDNVRSIPALTDGLKPSQRKALYGILHRGENAGLMQVERLAAAVAATTDYHHGIGSMCSTMVGLAVNYPGSNNVNLLVPEGQFGSRLTAEPAAARYIETRLHPNFRALFPKADDRILEHHDSNGEKIEPKTFTPLLPLALVNGAQGTGTGHACLILSYKPSELIQACLAVAGGKKLKRGGLTPWFRGFNGRVERVQETGQVVVTGKLEIVNTTTIKVTELPVGTYLDQYKAHLNKLEDAGFIKDYEDRSTEEAFEFTVTCPRSTTTLDEATLYQKFKLIYRDTENFTIWGVDGVLERFDSPEAIVEAFVPWRLEQLEKRRLANIAELREDLRFTNEKLRFILYYLAHVNEFKNKKKDDLVALLLKNAFTDYDRLLSMPMWNLTHDKIEELKAQATALKKALTGLEADTASWMYTRELKELKV